MKGHIHRKKKAQLLLVTCILLSLTLLTVAIIVVQIAPKAAELSSSNASITQEYSVVKKEFGRSVSILANQKMEETTTADFEKEAIGIAVSEATHSYRMIEARHGLSFDARFDPQTGFLNNQNPYKIKITLSLASENTHIVEEAEYVILFDFKEI